MPQQFLGAFTSHKHKHAGDSLIHRSKKEIKRLFSLTKTPYARVEHAHESSSGRDASSDDSEWNSSVESLDVSDEPSESDEDEPLNEQSSLTDSDIEQPYERLPRKVGGIKDTEGKARLVPRLPIKLPSGQIQQTGVRQGSTESSDDGEEPDPPPQKPLKQNKRYFAGTMFGKASVGDVIRIQPRPERIQSAKEQIAEICQEIMSEPEKGVSDSN